MQTQVMFYILNDDPNGSSFHHACYQAANAYRNNQRVFIFSENTEQAHRVDELLWSFEPDSFVPHNLAGEGPRGGAPVEISWQAPGSRRPVLINLTREVPNFAGQFSTVIDFVPTDETLKQQARERFRSYRQLGFQVNNQTVASTTTAEVGSEQSANDATRNE